jgi:hypothetical protein
MARVADTNVPRVPLRWSIARAGAEFDLAQATLERKLRDPQQVPDDRGAYSTKAITRAIYGSLFAERLRRITEEADKTAIGNQFARGELIARSDLEPLLSRIAESIIQIVKGSALNSEAKTDILHSISSMRVVVERAARRQASRRGSGLNGSALPGATAKPKRGRPKKAANAKPAAGK